MIKVKVNTSFLKNFRKVTQFFFLLIILSYLFVIGNFESNNFSGRKLLESKQQWATTFLNQQYNLPRYTYFTSGRHLTRIPPGFCDPTPGTNGTQCNYGKYIESIALFAAPGLIIAFLALIFWPIFWILRPYCFGGCRPSKGICCPSESFDEGEGEGYSSNQVLYLKITTYIIVVISIAACVMGLIGNSEITQAVEEFGNTVINTGQEIIFQLKNISATVDSSNISYLNISININKTLTTFINEGSTILSQVKHIQNLANHYDTIREGILIGFGVFSILLFLFIFLGAILNLPMAALIMGIFGFLGMALIWIIFSVHFSTSVLLADICHAVNQAEHNNSHNQLINAIVNCASTPAFVNMLHLTNSVINSSKNYVCQAMEKACDKQYPHYLCNTTNTNNNCTAMNCTNFNPKTNCSFTTIPNFQNNTIREIFPGCKVGGKCFFNNTCNYTACYEKELTIKQCSENCSNTQLKSISSEIINGTNTLELYHLVLREHLDPLLQCVQVEQGFQQLHYDLCVNFALAIFYIIITSAVVGSFFIAGIVVGILGSKRFNKNNWSLSLED